MSNILNFKDGIAPYSNQLKTEILAVIQSIEKNDSLEKDQMELVMNVFKNLYEYEQVKIMKKRGRATGKINPNLSLIVYLVVRAIDTEGKSVTVSLNEVSEKYSVGAKTLEKAYHEMGEEIRDSLKNIKNYQTAMEYGVKVYLKK